MFCFSVPYDWVDYLTFPVVFTSILTAVFPGERGLDSTFVSSCTCSSTEPFAIGNIGFYGPSVHLVMQPAVSKQQKTVTKHRPQPVALSHLSSFPSGLPVEGAYFLYANCPSLLSLYILMFVSLPRCYCKDIAEQLFFGGSSFIRGWRVVNDRMGCLYRLLFTKMTSCPLYYNINECSCVIELK